MSEPAVGPGNVVGIEALRAQVEARKAEEEARLAEEAKGKDKGGGGPEDPKWVLDCLANNERGDGLLFTALHRNRFCYEKTSQRWLEYPTGGHHWQLDQMGRVVSGVEQVALTYLAQASALSEEIATLKGELRLHELKHDQAKAAEDPDAAAEERTHCGRLSGEIERLGKKRGALHKRVDRLRAETGAKKALFWAHSVEEPLAVTGDQIDKHPMLFACANGVVDLETGQLRPGAPSDWLVKASPVHFPDGVQEYLRTGDGCPCPGWDAFQREVVGEDPEVFHFWHKLLGLSITGRVSEHIITVCVGAGRNGKGTTFELLQDLLGDFSWVISPELILEQKSARSSQGAAADIVSLQGRRLVVGAETDENRRISGSAVKSLTGGDTLKARPLYQADEIQIAPTWKLFLHTNSVPKGLTKDFALQQRLVYVNFPFSYVDNPENEAKLKPAMAGFFRVKDRGLPARLAQEMPGIFAWLVRGCLLWQREGLSPPARIRADVEQLRQDEDVVGQFVATWCRPEEGGECLLKDWYSVFEKWHQENHGDHVMSRKRAASELVARGYRKDQRGGNIRLYGLRLLTDWERENASAG